MADFSEMTPAFYAFSQEISSRLAREQASVIREFLEKEGDVYQWAFSCYMLAEYKGRGFSRDIFANGLYEGETIKADLDVVELLGASVHDEYWRLAKKEDYWLNGQRSTNCMLSFDALLELWRKLESNDLQQGEFMAKQLRENLHS
jgi:hypothetical protein